MSPLCLHYVSILCFFLDCNLAIITSVTLNSSQESWMRIESNDSFEVIDALDVKDTYLTYLTLP